MSTAAAGEIAIEEPRGRIDYDETGAGPTVVLVPGSCSTGAAWRPVIAQWDGRYRCVTTSLSGYGGTAERRTARDPSIVHEAEILETVIRRAGGRAHVVAHSFGGIVALAVALRKRVTLESLVIAEAPAAELLRSTGEHEHYRAFRDMTQAYFDAFCDGDMEAIGTMIDFYGGAGTFDSWPGRVRDYAVATTSVNIRDWATVYSFPLSSSLLAAIDVPALVLWGGSSHPAVQRANQLLGQCLEGASCAPVDGAAHFMISTHAQDVARRVAAHIDRVQRSLHGEPPARRPSPTPRATTPNIGPTTTFVDSVLLVGRYVPRPPTRAA